MWELFNNHLAADGMGGSSGPIGSPSSDMGKEDMIDFLGTDDTPELIELPKKTKGELPKSKDEEPEEKEESEETDESEEETEEVDELEEIEDELKEPTEEDLELTTPVRRREILKKYPKLFEDFPYLEKAYYREQQFTEIFPTIPEAKEASQAKETLNNFESDLTKGNIEPILTSLNKTSPESFAQLVDNYLPVLAKVDNNAYHHVIGNIIKHTIKAMVRESRASGNEALQNAAAILNQYTFGKSDFDQPVNFAKETPKDNKAEDAVKQREQAFIKRQFETAQTDLSTRVNNSLRATIDANIDPKKSMTDWVRKTASREALENLNNLVSKDSRFRQLVDKLWKDAIDKNFSQESTSRIRSACLSKAKTLLPSVIKKARNDALRGMGKRVRDVDDEDRNDQSEDKKGPVTPGRSTRSNSEGKSEKRSGKITKPEDIPKGMKTLDFLMSD